MGVRSLLSRLATLSGLALLLGGCLPESESPLTPPELAVAAPELLGLWQAPIEDAMLFIHVLRGDGEQLQVVTVAHEMDGTGDTELYLGHVSEAGGRRFVNLLPADAAAAQRYVFVGYDVTGATLTVHLLSPEALAAAIDAGALTGEVAETSLGLDVRLTGPGEQIAAFLGSADADSLYGRTLTLQRVDIAR